MNPVLAGRPAEPSMAQRGGYNALGGPSIALDRENRGERLTVVMVGN
ncbi:MAG: hypothetical protein ABSA93_20550 [Streptosporangiaceae bacterium]